MYFVSTAIILNKVIIFYKALDIFWRWLFWPSEINVKTRKWNPISWDLWTADQFYQWCFAFKQSVWQYIISDMYGRLFLEQ